jgi:peptidoglycan/LPS O-acetylase OafA/YrhL
LKYFTIAWSLEIEFWFYLLSPILAFVVQSFSQKNKNFIIIIVIIIGICADYFGERNGTNLVYYLHFFGAGMLVSNNFSKKYLSFLSKRTSLPEEKRRLSVFT